MDTNQTVWGLGGSQSAGRSITLNSNTRPLDPESSFGPSWLHSQREKFDQMALNYSGSQAAASSNHDSHRIYRKREGPSAQGQWGDTMDSVTESGVTTEDASIYSYHSARDLSAFVKEVDGRFVRIFIRSLYSLHYLECLIISQTFTCCQVVNISTKAVSRSHTKTPLDDGEFQRLCVLHSTRSSCMD